jgi:hypothetical protein
VFNALVSNKTFPGLFKFCSSCWRFVNNMTLIRTGIGFYDRRSERVSEIPLTAFSSLRRIASSVWASSAAKME